LQKEDRAQKRCNQAGWAGIVRVWFIDELKLSMIREEKRREEPKKGLNVWMSPSCSGSSRPGIPAEMDRQTIRDLHVAIRGGTLLSNQEVRRPAASVRS